jgi:hypothetical protein
MEFLFCAVDIEEKVHILAAVGFVMGNRSTDSYYLSGVNQRAILIGFSDSDPDCGLWVWVGEPIPECTNNYYNVGKEFEGYLKGKWRKPTYNEIINFFQTGDPWIDMRCDCANENKEKLLNSDDIVRSSVTRPPGQIAQTVKAKAICSCCVGCGYRIFEMEEGEGNA